MATKLLINQACKVWGPAAASNVVYVVYTIGTYLRGRGLAG